MRILILVQTCDDAPYLEMTKAQMETWDSIEHPDCRTVYYISSKNGPFDHYTDKGKKLYLDCSEDYNMMHWRNNVRLIYFAKKNNLILYSEQMLRVM